jgi:hypothetical protein
LRRFDDNCTSSHRQAQRSDTASFCLHLLLPRCADSWFAHEPHAEQHRLHPGVGCVYALRLH